MANLNNSFVYKKFKPYLINKIGKDNAKNVWEYSNKELKRLRVQYNEVTSDEKMMVLPLVALYKGLINYNIENPIILLKEYAKETGVRFSKLIHKFTSIPFVPKLLWKNMPKLMRNSSSSKKGYERRIISETNELVGVDILKCPLHELTKKLGVPELTSVICTIDKGQMSGFKHIEYTRTQALGDGDEFCDYRLRFSKDKK